MNTGMLTVVDYQVEQCKRLVQGNFTFAGFIPNTIHNVALHPEEFGKDVYDNGGFSILGKPEYYAAGFVKHVLVWGFEFRVSSSKFRVDVSHPRL